MSILETVYKTFSTLDRDYARSKKSRSDFITDKFGGDISVGSIIILDAIREEGVSDSPEDIEKLSFIKDSFAFFQENAHRLDRLETFSHCNADVFFEFLGILSKAENHMTGQFSAPQAQLWNSPAQALHYVSDISGTRYTPLEACKVYYGFNENMLATLEETVGAYGLKMGEKCRIGANGKVRIIADAAVARHVK